MSQLMPGFFDPDRDQKISKAPYYVSEHVGLTFVYPKFAPDDRGRTTELTQEEAYKLYVGQNKNEAEMFTSKTDAEDRVLALVQEESNAPIVIDEARNRELMQMINPVPMSPDDYEAFRVMEPLGEAGHFILSGLEGLTGFIENSFKKITDIPSDSYEQATGRTLRNYVENPADFMNEESLATRLRKSLDEEREYAIRSYQSDPDAYELPLSATYFRGVFQANNLAATFAAFPYFIGLDVGGTYQETVASDGHELATGRALAKAAMHAAFLKVLGRVSSAYRPDAAFRAGAARRPMGPTGKVGEGLVRTGQAGTSAAPAMEEAVERGIGGLISKLFRRKRTAYESDRTFAVSPDGVAQRIGISAAERRPIIEALSEAGMGVGVLATYEAFDQALIEVFSEYGAHMEMYKDLSILDRVGHAVSPETLALFAAFGAVKYGGIPGTEMKGLKKIGDDLYRGGQRSTQAVADELYNLSRNTALTQEEKIVEYFNILAKAEQFKFHTTHAASAQQSLFDPEVTSTELLFRIRDTARFRMREGAHGRDAKFDPSLDFFLLQQAERAIEARGLGVFNPTPNVLTSPQFMGSTNPFIGPKPENGEVQPAFFGKVPPRSLHNMGQLSRSINFMFPRPEDQYIPPPGIPDPVDLNKPIMSEQELNDMIKQNPETMDFLRAELTEKGKILTYGQLLKKNGYSKTDITQGIDSMSEVSPATLVYLADSNISKELENLVVPANIEELSGIEGALDDIDRFADRPYGRPGDYTQVEKFDERLGDDFIIPRDLFDKLTTELQNEALEFISNPKYKGKIRFAEPGDTPTFDSKILVEIEIRALTSLAKEITYKESKTADILSRKKDDVTTDLFLQAYRDSIGQRDLFKNGVYQGFRPEERGLLVANTAIPGSTFTAFDGSMRVTVLPDYQFLFQYEYDGKPKTFLNDFDVDGVLPVDLNPEAHSQSAMKFGSLFAERFMNAFSENLPDAVMDDLVKAEQAGFLHKRDPRTAEHGAEIVNPDSHQVLKNLREGKIVDAEEYEIVPFGSFQSDLKPGKKPKLISFSAQIAEKMPSLVHAIINEMGREPKECIKATGVTDYAVFAVVDSKGQYVKDDSGLYYFSFDANDFGRIVASQQDHKLVVLPANSVFGKEATGYSTKAIENFADRSTESNWEKTILDFAYSSTEITLYNSTHVRGIFSELGLSKQNAGDTWSSARGVRAKFANILAKQFLDAYRESSGNQEADLFDMVIDLGRGEYSIIERNNATDNRTYVSGHGRGDANFDSISTPHSGRFVVVSSKNKPYRKAGSMDLGDALDEVLLRTFPQISGVATPLPDPEFATFSNLQKFLGDKSLAEVVISAAREAGFRVVHFGTAGSRGGFVPITTKAKDPKNRGLGADPKKTKLQGSPFNVKASAPEPRPVPGSNKPKVVNGRVEHRNVGGATPPQKPPTGKPPAPPAGGAPDPDKGVRAPQSFLEATANLGKRIKGRKTIITPDYIVAKFFTEKGMAESRMRDIVDAKAGVKAPIGQRQLEARKRALVRAFYQAAQRGSNLAYNEGRKAARAKAESEFQRLKEKIAELKQQIKDNKDDVKLRQEQAGKIRQMIEEAELPRAIKNIIIANVTRGRMTTDEQMARLLDRTELLIQQAYYKGSLSRAKAVMRLVQKKASQNPGEEIALSQASEAAVRAILNGAPVPIALRPISQGQREAFEQLMQIEAFANSSLADGIKARMNEPTGSITQFGPDDTTSLGALQNAETSLNAIADDLMDVLARNDAEAEGAAVGKQQLMMKYQMQAAVHVEAAAQVGVFNSKVLNDVGSIFDGEEKLSALEQLTENMQAGGFGEFFLSADSGAEVIGGGTDSAIYRLFDALHEAEITRLHVNNNLEAGYSQALREAGLSEPGRMQEFSRTHNKGREMSDDVLYALVDGEGKQLLVDGSELVGICCTMTSGNMLSYYGKQIGDGFSERGFVTFDDQLITSVVSSMERMRDVRSIDGFRLVQFFVDAFNNSQLAENTRNNLSRQFNRGEVESLTHSYMPASRFVERTLHPNESHALEFTTPEEVQNYLLAEGEYAQGRGETLFLQKILGFKQESQRPLQIFDATRFLMNRARTQNATFSTLAPLKDLLDVLQSSEVLTVARKRNIQGRLQELRQKFLSAGRDQLGLPLADRTASNRIFMAANKNISTAGLAINFSAFFGQQTSLTLANAMMPAEYRVNIPEVLREQALWQSFTGMFNRTLSTTEGKGPAAIALHAGMGGALRVMRAIAQRLGERVGVKIFDKIDGQIMEMPEVMDLVHPDMRDVAELMFKIDPQQVDRHQSGNTSLVSGFTAADLEFQTAELNQITQLTMIGIMSNDLAACNKIYQAQFNQATDEILTLAQRHKRGETNLEGTLRDHMGIDHTAEIHDRALDFFGDAYGNVDAMRPRMMEFLGTDVVGRLVRRRASYIIRRSQPEFNALYAPKATMLRRESPKAAMLFAFSGFRNKATEFVFMSHYKKLMELKGPALQEARKAALARRVEKIVESDLAVYDKENPEATPEQRDSYAESKRREYTDKFGPSGPPPGPGSYYNASMAQAMAAWAKSDLLYYAIKRIFKLLLNPISIATLMRDLGEDPVETTKEEFDALFQSFTNSILTTPPTFGIGASISHGLGFSWSSNPALISTTTDAARTLGKGPRNFADFDAELNYYQQAVSGTTYTASGLLQLLALADPRFALLEAARRQGGRVLSLRDTLELIGAEKPRKGGKKKKRATQDLGRVIR